MYQRSKRKEDREKVCVHESSNKISSHELKERSVYNKDEFFCDILEGNKVESSVDVR